MEERVAQLEMAMSKDGLSNFGQDHWGVMNDHESTDCNTSSPLQSLQCVPIMPTQLELNPTEESTAGSLTRQKTSESGDMLALAMRDLSLQAHGGFVGASAYLALGRAVAGIVSAMESTPRELSPQEHTKNLDRLLSSSIVERQPVDNLWNPEFNISNISPDVAGRLLHGYLSYIPSRWPILHRSHILDLHSRRDRLENDYESFALTFVYAIGGRYLNPVSQDGESFPMEFFQSALKRLDVIIGLNDIRSVVCLLLLSIFSLKGPSGPSVW